MLIYSIQTISYIISCMWGLKCSAIESEMNAFEWSVLWGVERVDRESGMGWDGLAGGGQLLLMSNGNAFIVLHIYYNII